nr:hypothetical protein [uncultured Psychroserpens sp.]
MIKIVALNSNIDNLIVNYFVIGVVVLIVLNRLVKQLKSLKGKSSIKGVGFNEEQDFTNYVLSFNAETVVVKKTSLFSKITLFSIAVIVAIMPFYEFVETLKPEAYIMPMTCFPGLSM